MTFEKTLETIQNLAGKNEPVKIAIEMPKFQFAETGDLMWIEGIRVVIKKTGELEKDRRIDCSRFGVEYGGASSTNQSGVAGTLPIAKAVPPEVPAYRVSGVLSAEFEPRALVSGVAAFFDGPKFPAVARMTIQTDSNGAFQVALPVGVLTSATVRAEIQFASETQVSLVGACPVSQTKPAVLTLPKPVNKRDAVHFYGVIVDDVSGEPAPSIGMYRDARGTLLARADEQGRFDFYVESTNGMTGFLPWLSGDQYAGHSYFFAKKPGESEELKLVIERGVRVRVHTVDESGAPLPGVYVRWMGAGGATGTTDEHGDALLGGMASRVRQGFLAEVRKKGYQLAMDRGPLIATNYVDQPLIIKLRPAAVQEENPGPLIATNYVDQSLIIKLHSAAAQDVSRRALAEELLNILNVPADMEKFFAMIKQGYPMQMKAMGATNMPTNVASQRDKMLDMLAQEYSWDKIKDDYIAFDAATYTEDEMKGAIAFFKSPAGQTYLKKEPELMKGMMELNQKLMMNIMPKIQAMTKELKETSPASATPENAGK